MLMPKKVKYRKHQRGRRAGNAKGGTNVDFGDFGLPPIVHGDLLLFNVGGRANHSLMAFDKRTGEVRWKTGTGIPGMAQLWDVYNLNPTTEPEPPDRDVVRFNVNAPAAAGSVVGWRFGTMNFDLLRDPNGPDLVVSNVDLRNDELVICRPELKDRVLEGIVSSGAVED